MRQEIVSYIKKKLQEYDSSISVADSSALVDLFVYPISSMLEPYQDKLDDAIASLSMKVPSNLSEDAMDGLAANFFISRTTGLQATGYVRMYFKSPKTIFIPVGAYFETGDGKTYTVTSAFSITESQMLANTERYPYYSTGDIPVTAVTFGKDGETGPDTIKVAKGLSVTYAFVTNPVAITGGVDREDNDQLSTKIQEAYTNLSLMSVEGIKKAIFDNFASISDISVIGAGDDEMIRDIIYTIDSSPILSNLPASYYNSDYFGSISGIHVLPGNLSIGYYGYFTATNAITASGISALLLPASPSAFSTEWTTTQYTLVYRLNDFFYQTLATTNMLISETFPAPNKTLLDWLSGDSSTDDGTLVTSTEILVNTGYVKIGTGTADTGTNPPTLPTS